MDRIALYMSYIVLCGYKLTSWLSLFLTRTMGWELSSLPLVEQLHCCGFVQSQKTSVLLVDKAFDLIVLDAERLGVSSPCLQQSPLLKHWECPVALKAAGLSLVLQPVSSLGVLVWATVLVWPSAASRMCWGPGTLGEVEWIVLLSGTKSESATVLLHMFIELRLGWTTLWLPSRWEAERRVLFLVEW